jgi:hypothetical protein
LLFGPPLGVVVLADDDDVGSGDNNILLREREKKCDASNFPFNLPFYILSNSSSFATLSLSLVVVVCLFPSLSLSLSQRVANEEMLERM